MAKQRDSTIDSAVNKLQSVRIIVLLFVKEIPWQFCYRMVWLFLVFSLQCSINPNFSLIGLPERLTMRKRSWSCDVCQLQGLKCEYTDCPLYRVPKHGSPRGTFHRMQVFYVIQLLCTGTRYTGRYTWVRGKKVKLSLSMPLRHRRGLQV
jgi:hypothetical protein